MFGILLAATSSVCNEISSSIGKWQVREKHASAYSFGFLEILFGLLLLVGWGITYGGFVFSLASLPTFLPRFVLEIVQAHVTVRAIVIADRSDFGFIRIWTVPLLLFVDTLLGYSLSYFQAAGIGLIVVTGVLLFSVEQFRVKGFWLVCFTAFNAVLTLSLYKYNITHFNSIEAEQSIIYLGIALYFFLSAIVRARENPFLLLKKPIFVLQSVTSGAGMTANAFAYSFGPAAVIAAAVRSASVLAAVISGRWYFGERAFLKKLGLFLLTAGALALLAL